MNIGRLRQLIANLPDDAEILVAGNDHSLSPGAGYVSDVVKVKVNMRSHRYFHAYDYETEGDGPPPEPKSALVIE